MKTKDVIAQAENRFEKEFGTFESNYHMGSPDKIKYWISTYTKDLLQSVVEITENLYPVKPYPNASNNYARELDDEEIYYAKALDDVSSSLSDIIKEIK